MRENGTCTFCKAAVETIVHLFWQCHISQIFIKEIPSHLKDSLNHYINSDCATCFFMLSDLTNVQIIVTTLSKSCIISKARASRQKPMLERNLRSLTLEANTEYKIAKLSIDDSILNGRYKVL